LPIIIAAIWTPTICYFSLWFGAMEIIGETASKVSPETRAKAPDVPWAKIAAMRNRLIHAYFDIHHDILWRTAVEEVPALPPLLSHLLAEE
jgi:uncharacterized protein with HEPN domain